MYPHQFPTWSVPLLVYEFQLNRRKRNVDLFLSEKKGLIAFPTISGKTDHTGFASADEISRRWCADLFEYYWDGGKIGTPKSYNGAEGGTST